PRGGRHPYVPPRPDWLKNPPRGSKNGYKDADDNEWRPHHPASSREEDFHWDVQHPNRRHTVTVHPQPSVRLRTPPPPANALGGLPRFHRENGDLRQTVRNVQITLDQTR